MLLHVTWNLRCGDLRIPNATVIITLIFLPEGVTQIFALAICVLSLPAPFSFVFADPLIGI
jgi:hypothetical protein